MRYIFGGGGELLYSHLPPYLPRGGNSNFSGGGGYLLYTIFPPIQVTGENGSITPD